MEWWGASVETLIKIGPLILVAITAWYAWTTRNILKKNSELVSATEKLAADTASIARASAESLYLESAPVLRLKDAKGEFNRDGPNVLRPCWVNSGKSIAINLHLGVFLMRADGLTMEKADKDVVSIEPGGEHRATILLEPPDAADMGNSAERSVYFARYYDVFHNKYESTQQPNQLWGVRRMEPNEPIGRGGPYQR